MRMRKGDLLVLVVTMLIGISFIYNYFFQDQELGNIAVLEIDGEVVEKFSLDGEIKQYRVETAAGFNTLAFEDGKVRVIEADCPDRLCVNFGWAQQVGQTIVCLPHKVIIRIENKAADYELDGVAY